MGLIVGLIAVVAGIASLVCFIIVLIKLFQEKGALQRYSGTNLFHLYFYLGLDER